MHPAAALKRFLSRRGWFPTIRVCATCKRITGVRWGEAHFIDRHWLEHSHGICHPCAAKVYKEHNL